MKILLKNILLFISPVMICLGLMEHYLRKIPNDYSYKAGYLQTNSSKTEVLYLGSSHIFFGINPEYSQYQSFNAAMTSQDLSLDWKIFNQRKRWDKLKTIVIPIDYISLYLRLENGVENWRMKNYVLYYDIESFNFSNHGEIFNGKFSENINRLQSFYREKKTNIDCNKLGFGTAYVHTIKKELKKDAIKAYKRHSVDITSNEAIQSYKENTKAIENFISYAKRNDVYILFVSVPVTSYYFRLTNNQQLSTTLSYIKEQVRNNKNIHYVNLMNNSLFSDHDFYDGDHLNDLGAKKFTLLLNREINIIPTK